ncbi:phage portal protein [Candidatus Dependentiae bacterium]|nr:MAG: phage portal protein [Candidatus Dependentiae bacterium]
MIEATATAVFGDGTSYSTQRPSRKALADREHTRARGQRQNEFAAAKNGLDSIRASFYSSTGRLPNTRSDATRRSRNLIGGSGNRHLCALDLWIEREISRTLRDQSSVFDGMVCTWAAEVIQTGFMSKPETGDDALNAEVKEALFGWDGDEGWCGECDSRGDLHFWELMTLAEETEVTDGDHAFYLDPQGNNDRGSVSIIEGDRILTPFGITLKPGFSIHNGIVMKDGYAVSAFVADEAPEWALATTQNGRFYPIFRPWRAAEGGLLLSISPKRYSSTRRQPWLSTAVRAHDEIDDVFTAVRVLLRNAACRATYTKIANWEHYKEWLQLVDPAYAAPAPTDALTHSPEPGDHVNLNPGEEGGVYACDAPGNNFDPFMQLQLNMLGLPLGMCIEEACRIFQKSFSASRQAIGGTRRRYSRRMRTVKRRKVSPILKFATARLQEVGVIRRDPRASRIRHTFPGWEYMEPLKDAQASEILINSNMASRETLRTEVGLDSEAEETKIARERALYPDQTPTPRTVNNIDAGGNP